MNTKCSSGPSVRATCPSNPVHFCYRFSIPTHKLNKPSKMHDEKTHVLNISPHTIHTTNVRCTCPSMCSTYKHVRSTIFLTEKSMKVHRTRMGCLNASPNVARGQPHSADNVQVGRIGDACEYHASGGMAKIKFPPDFEKWVFERLDCHLTQEFLSHVESICTCI